jgi:eukaryotic-like serine/threonine-protein kinase
VNRKYISRRTFMLRLAGLTVMGTAGSSLVLLACSQQPAAPASPTSLHGSTALYTYHGHSAAVYAVAWNPDGKRIASGSNDGTVQVWDAADGGHVFTYRGHSDVVEALAWSPGGKRIASASDDNTVQVWVAA